MDPFDPLLGIIFHEIRNRFLDNGLKGRRRAYSGGIAILQ